MGELELFEEKSQVIWKVDAEEAKKHLLEWKMLENNEISGFLPFHYYYIDNEIQFRYEYSSFQRLEEYFKTNTGNYEIIFLICEEILKILEKGQEYLLDPMGCLFQPEWIFWNKQEKKVKICFLPGREGDVRKDYTMLVEYLMRHTEHGDKKLVTMIYGLYDRLVSDRFSPEQLIQYLQDFINQDIVMSENSSSNEDTEQRKVQKDALQKSDKEDLYVRQRTNAKKNYYLEPFPMEIDSNLAKCLLYAQKEEGYLIGTGEFVVGREKKSDVYIPFCEISRRHAVLASEGMKLYVMDTASKNGTYLNGNKISAYVKTSCQENDIITFADISYKIRRI